VHYFIGRKSPEYYKGLLIKADLGVHEQIAQKIQTELPKGSCILDLGAGEGALSLRLSDLGYQVTSADKDANNFNCGKSAFFCLNFDIPDEIIAFVAAHEVEFDAVLGVEVIEHVQDQWQYVRQLMKMTKPGGLVLITTPNISSWLSRASFFLTGQFHQFTNSDLSYGHINPISPWQLALIMQMSGAVDIKMTPCGTLPPVYFTGFNRVSLLNLIILPVRFVMSGLLDGWCVMATARKPR
jgi:cyclopropane fatty-acyl-phospholipid synthase-like methyltransferase